MSFREISLDKFNNAVWTLKPYSKSLTHWDRDKMAAISQTTFSNGFSWMKMYEFRLTFHWSWFLGVQLTIFEHWFRQWLGADQASSHYLNHWWLDYRRICVTRGLNELTPRENHENWYYCIHQRAWSEIILGMGSANEKWSYNVTSSLIGWAQAQIDACWYYPSTVITISVNIDVPSVHSWENCD